MSTKWIPEGEKNLITLCLAWLAMLSNEQMTIAFKWIEELCAITGNKIDAFLKAVEAYRENDNTANRTAKNEAKAEAIRAMRNFADSSVRHNPYMTEADRREMGLHKPDTTPTPTPQPLIMPELQVNNTVSHLQHRIRVMNPNTGRTGKPAGVHGIRYAWQAGGERPVSGEELKHGRFSRRAELILTHPEPDRGKIAYYAARYENSRGDAGPWSFVMEAYIG